MQATAIPPLLMCLALLGCGGSSNVIRASEQCRPVPCRKTTTQVLDLTQPLQLGMASTPDDTPFRMTRVVDYDQGYRKYKLEIAGSIGTHVDAPAHFFDGKRTIMQLPVDELMVEVVVLDVRAKVDTTPDYLITANDIDDWEAAHGEVPIGSLLIANTGWHKRFSDPAKYANQDAAGVMHFPGFSKAAAQLLVERDVVGVGIDTLSVDHGMSKTFEAHKVILAANKYQLENLANLDMLPATGARVIIAVLPIVGGTEAPARVVALVPVAEPKTFSD